MKKKLPLIIVIVIFLVGVGVLAYPLLSSVINNYAARQQADTYIQKALDSDTAALDAEFSKAQTYNDSLHRIILTDPFDADSYGLIGERYTETLNTDGNGLICFVDIPKISVYLPVYHGTSIDVLSVGAGHLEQTSLPVGGKGTHSVISAHSAFPSRTFFDYLTDLEIGDEFYIHVLNRTLKYEVDDINVVLPTDTSNLYIDEDEDYVTLLTCTPYSVNTHRLLVRGTRVAYNSEDQSGDIVHTVQNSGGSLFIMGYKIPYPVVGLFIGGFVLFTAAVVFLMIRFKKQPKHSEDRR